MYVWWAYGQSWFCTIRMGIDGPWEGVLPSRSNILPFRGSLVVGEEVISSDFHEPTKVGCVSHTALVAIGNLTQNRK